MGGEFLSRVVEKIVLKTFFIWLGFVADDDKKVMITAKRTKSDIQSDFTIMRTTTKVWTS